MAKLTAGILGDVKGKVGNVVGGMFKGINYVRAYFIPSNPQSTNQTINRNKLKEIVRLSKPVLSTFIRSYYRSIISGLSTTEWAEHIKRNMLSMTSGTDYADYGFKDNANYWYTDPEFVDGAGIITLSWTVEDYTKATAKPYVVLTQPALAIPAKVIEPSITLADDEIEIATADYTTSKDLYVSIAFKFEDPITGEITWSTAHNFGKVHTGA